MKQPKILQVNSRIKRLSLPQQIFHLRALIQLERPYTSHRNDLRSLLDGKMLKQLRRETRTA